MAEYHPMITGGAKPAIQPVNRTRFLRASHDMSSRAGGQAGRGPVELRDTGGELEVALGQAAVAWLDRARVI